MTHACGVNVRDLQFRVIRGGIVYINILKFIVGAAIYDFGCLAILLDGGLNAQEVTKSKAPTMPQIPLAVSPPPTEK